jgi:anti-anti-sigma factor
LTQDPSSVPYEVEIVRQGSGAIVRVNGEFDLTAAQDVRDRLPQVQTEPVRELVLDLRGTTFIDSSGIGVIVQLWNESRHDGFGFSVLAADGHVRELLKMTGLSDTVPIIEGR